MKANRKSEEGAVLLLLIIMMSAVVLIAASLLKFNTQNIKFAAIEIEQEQALYLAEGIADHIDYKLVQNASSLTNSTSVSSKINDILTPIKAGNPYGLPKFTVPANSFIKKDASAGPIVHIDNPDNPGTDTYTPDIHGVLKLTIEVESDDARRKILVTYEFPSYPPADEITSFIVSKELNYTN